MRLTKCQGATTSEWRSANASAAASYCFSQKSWFENIDSLGPG